MVSKVVAGVIALVVSIVLVFVALQAQGVASAPSAQISTTVNPALTQSVQVTFIAKEYSLFSPNPLFQPGGKFVYSAWQTNSKGGENVLAQNQSIASSPTGITGGVYTLTATVTFSMTAICSGESCIGQPFNLTIDVKQITQTYLAFWESPTSHIVFSNLAQYNSVPPVTTPSPETYYLELFGPLTAVVVVVALLFAILKPHWIEGLVLVLAIVALLAQIVFWAP